MSFAEPIARFVDRLNGSIPDDALHFELIKALYGATSTPKALFIASGAAVSIAALSWHLTSDNAYLGYTYLSTKTWPEPECAFPAHRVP